MITPAVAVIGAGAAGTLTAVHLVRTALDGGQPMVVSLIDPCPETGAGVAYSTQDDRHRLNVPAARMSAYPDDPGHFLRWLRTRHDPATQPGDFAARREYGYYLSDVLAEAIRSAAGRVRLVRHHERVISIRSSPASARLELESGRPITADAVVLAPGPPAPSTDWAPDELRRSDRFVPDPWRRHALSTMDDDLPVLLVGTGLTMVDVALTLDRPARALHAVSRTGWLPRTHTATALPPLPPPAFPASGLRLADVRRLVDTHVAISLDQYGDWRPAVDGLRRISTRLWQQLPHEDQREFLVRDARRWEIHRHRMAPSVGERIAQCRRQHRLQVRAGEVVAVAEAADRLRITLRDRTVLDVGWVVNCTGPRIGPGRGTDPLLDGLVDSGTARPGPLGIGLDTAATGQLRGRDGSLRTWLWTLGATRRGQLWESTAIAEIREQAAMVASGILVRLGGQEHSGRPSRALVSLPAR
jgi:uncharacterized NAD(P)/FAD-binding protein YdhS